MGWWPRDGGGSGAGEGKCPFGTSCFYRHVYRDGTPWTPDLRKVGTAEGGMAVVQVLSYPREHIARLPNQQYNVIRATQAYACCQDLKQ